MDKVKESFQEATVRLHEELAGIQKQLDVLKAEGQEDSVEAKKLAGTVLIKAVEMQAHMIKDLYSQINGLGLAVQEMQSMVMDLLGFRKAGIISPGSKRFQ